MDAAGYTETRRRSQQPWEEEDDTEAVHIETNQKTAEKPLQNLSNPMLPSIPPSKIEPGRIWTSRSITRYKESMDL